MSDIVAVVTGNMIETTLTADSPLSIVRVDEIDAVALGNSIDTTVSSIVALENEAQADIIAYSIDAQITQQEIQADIFMGGPKGDPGTASATITVGAVDTGAPGTDASVINVGTESQVVLNFTIPQGLAGAAGNVTYAASIHNFPSVGDAGGIYVSTDENAIYRWNESNATYTCIGRDYTNIANINGGSANG